MADARAAISLYAHRLVVCRLDAGGAPVVGNDNLIVTEDMVRVDYTPNYDTTDAVTKPNGRGGSCLNVPARSRLTGVGLTVELCKDDPMLYELLGGGQVLTEGAGTDVVGYQLPGSNDPERAGVGLEVWTEAWDENGRDPDRPWFRFVFPRASLTWTDRSLAAELDTKSFEGSGAESAGYGTGPLRDATFDCTKAMQYVRTAQTPPEPTNGYAPIAAVTP